MMILVEAEKIVSKPIKPRPRPRSSIPKSSRDTCDATVPKPRRGLAKAKREKAAAERAAMALIGSGRRCYPRT